MLRCCQSAAEQWHLLQSLGCLQRLFLLLPGKMIKDQGLRVHRKRHRLGLLLALRGLNDPRLEPRGVGCDRHRSFTCQVVGGRELCRHRHADRRCRLGRRLRHRGLGGPPLLLLTGLGLLDRCLVAPRGQRQGRGVRPLGHGGGDTDRGRGLRSLLPLYGFEVQLLQFFVLKGRPISRGRSVASSHCIRRGGGPGQPRRLRPP